MKKFKFKLETVQKIKIKIEEIRQQELAAAQNVREQACQELLRRRETVRVTTELYRDNIQKKLDLQLMLYYQRYLSWLNEQVDLASRFLSQCEREVEEARERLVVATKERKIIDKLKERAYQAYLAEELNEEIKFLDEIGTGRYVRDSRARGEGVRG